MDNKCNIYRKGRQLFKRLPTDTLLPGMLIRSDTSMQNIRLVRDVIENDDHFIVYCTRVASTKTPDRLDVSN